MKPSTETRALLHEAAALISADPELCALFLGICADLAAGVVYSDPAGRSLDNAITIMNAVLEGVVLEKRR